MPKKRLTTVAMKKKNKGTKGSNSIKASYSKKETRSPPVPPLFPCRVKNAASLLEQRINDEVICLPNVEFLPIVGDQKDSKYCPFHLRKGHLFKQWFTFRKIFNEKHKVERSFSKKESINIMTVEVKNMP